MAAGLGFKTFTTGEVLTAANVNGYLMQGVLVFASAAARDSAITSPQEGQTCYLKDTDAVLTYSGSAWVAVGGGGGGGMTLLSTTTLSGASTTISSINQTYNDLFVLVTLVNLSSARNVRCAPNAVTNLSAGVYTCTNNSGVGEIQVYVDDYIQLNPRNYLVSGSTTNSFAFTLNNYASSASHKPFTISGSYNDDASRIAPFNGGGSFRSNTAISSLEFSVAVGSFSGGTVQVYGVK